MTGLHCGIEGAYLEHGKMEELPECQLGREKNKTARHEVLNCLWETGGCLSVTGSAQGGDGGNAGLPGGAPNHTPADSTAH